MCTNKEEVKPCKIRQAKRVHMPGGNGNGSKSLRLARVKLGKSAVQLLSTAHSAEPNTKGKS